MSHSQIEPVSVQHESQQLSLLVCVGGFLYILYERILHGHQGFSQVTERFLWQVSPVFFLLLF